MGPRKERKKRTDLHQRLRSSRYVEEAKRLQGLPAEWDLPPFTVQAKIRALGNAVLLPLGRAVASAVKRALMAEKERADEDDANLLREAFTPSDLVAIGRDVEEEERRLAEERRLSTLKRGDKAPVRENFHDGEKGKSRDRVGARLGVSGKHYEKARAVAEAAEAEPAKYGDLVHEMDESRSVNSAWRKLRQRRARSSGRA